MITAAPDAASAKASLQVQVRLHLHKRQAEAVLAMPLQRLTGLKQHSLRREAEDLRQERARLRHLLEKRLVLLNAKVGELDGLKSPSPPCAKRG
jgi:DNA gyrase subunit A